MMRTLVIAIALMPSIALAQVDQPTTQEDSASASRFQRYYQLVKNDFMKTESGEIVIVPDDLREIIDQLRLDAVETRKEIDAEIAAINREIKNQDKSWSQEIRRGNERNGRERIANLRKESAALAWSMSSTPGLAPREFWNGLSSGAKKRLERVGISKEEFLAVLTGGGITEEAFLAEAAKINKGKPKLIDCLNELRIFLQKSIPQEKPVKSTLKPVYVIKLTREQVKLYESILKDLDTDRKSSIQKLQGLLDKNSVSKMKSDVTSQHIANTRKVHTEARVRIMGLKTWENYVLPDFYFEGRSGYTLMPERLMHPKITQVVDENTLLVRADDTTMMLKMPTDGYADGDSLDIEKTMFSLIGTESYTTVLGGTNTVRVYERLDPAVERAVMSRIRDLGQGE